MAGNPSGNAAISSAGINPAERTMTRTFSDPTMTTKGGFYSVKTPFQGGGTSSSFCVFLISRTHPFCIP